MASYQTPDSKKEEFRKYLEKSGVIDALTKVLVRLYEEPEKPGNALDFIKQYLGASVGVDVEHLRAVSVPCLSLHQTSRATHTIAPWCATTLPFRPLPFRPRHHDNTRASQRSHCQSMLSTLPLQENDEQKKRIEDLTKQLEEANAKLSEAGQ